MEVLKDKIDKMLDVMSEIVDDHGSWEEKRNAILQLAEDSDRYQMALDEFLSWFGEELE